MFEELFTESAHQVMIMAAEATYQLRHSAIGYRAYLDWSSPRRTWDCRRHSP